MKLVLTPNTTDGGTALTFEKMPAVEIACSTSHKNATAIAQYVDTTWTISGVLVNGTTTVAAQLGVLETLLSKGRLLSAKITTDANVDVIVLSNDYEIKIATYNYPSTGAPEFATRRTFVITLSGRKFVGDAASNGIYSYTITYTTDQSGQTTRDINVTMNDEKSKYAKSKLEDLISTNTWLAWGTQSILVNNKIGSNEDGSQATASITHVEFWLAYPSGITNCEISSEFSTDKFGTVYYKQSGWFEGSDSACAAAVATRMALASHIISNSVNRQPYSNRTSFSIESLGSTGQGNSAVYYAQETLTINEAVQDTVFKRILGGSTAPMKQVTALSTATATQSGIIKKISGWPDVPAAKWASDIKSKSVSRLPTENRNDGYVIQYNYTFEFTTTPSF